jgi:hypothetical protein
MVYFFFSTSVPSTKLPHRWDESSIVLMGEISIALFSGTVNDKPMLAYWQVFMSSMIGGVTLGMKITRGFLFPLHGVNGAMDLLITDSIMSCYRMVKDGWTDDIV